MASAGVEGGEWAARTRAVTERMHPAEAPRSECRCKGRQEEAQVCGGDVRCPAVIRAASMGCRKKSGGYDSRYNIRHRSLWQLPHEQLPPLGGYEATLRNLEQIRARGHTHERGGGGHVHNFMRHVVTNADRTTSGDYEAALAVRIKNPRTRQSSFVAVVYGVRREEKRPAVLGSR
jgi:hypothetical protein